MGKAIVFCADGTWNGAGKDELLEADKPELSNVYLLFRQLMGEQYKYDGGPGLWVEVKRCGSPQNLSQVAMYCHGVGENQRNLEEKIIGGAFGGGLTTRIRMGYMFISQQYEPGDRIVILGFSRGAYSARALADLIAEQGLLRKGRATSHLTLSAPAAAWLIHRKATRPRQKQTLFSRLVNESENLHFEVLQRSHLVPAASDFIPASVDALGVFDTVGSLGLPDLVNRLRVDDYQFVSPDLHPNIRSARHAISLDEERQNFRPTFWLQNDPARLVQYLFPGAHSDVGGGYAEHRLSDVPLQWMGKYLSAYAELKPWDCSVDPCPLAIAHRPWATGLAKIGAAARMFPPEAAMTISLSIKNRMQALAVPVEGVASQVPYRPTNLPS